MKGLLALARQSFFEAMAKRALRAAIRDTQKAIAGRNGQPSKMASTKKTVPKAPRGLTQYFVTTPTLQLLESNYTYPVSGESSYPEAFRALWVATAGLKEEVYVPAYLVPEPDNPVSGDAVAVVLDKWVVGHIPRGAAKHFAEFLDGRVGECGARVYFDPNKVRNSIELNVSFPPQSSSESYTRDIPFVGSEAPSYDMHQVTTRGHRMTLTHLKQGVTFEGVARVDMSYGFDPEIVDNQTGAFMGSPYPTISWDFNIFARSMGGSYRVRYKLELNEKGRPKLTLDGSGLPEFRKSKY
jgi:hypothetical protein